MSLDANEFRVNSYIKLLDNMNREYGLKFSRLNREIHQENREPTDNELKLMLRYSVISNEAIKRALYIDEYAQNRKITDSVMKIADEHFKCVLYAMCNENFE